MTRTPSVAVVRLVLGACLALAVAACGGRAGARPVTGPQTAVRLDPTPARPQRLGESAAFARDGSAIAEEDLGGADPLPAGAAPRPGMPVAPPDGGIVHRLRRGETLYSLSRAHGVPVAEVMRLNRITDPSSIRAGTPIVIPSAAAPSPARPPGARPQPPAPDDGDGGEGTDDDRPPDEGPDATEASVAGLGLPGGDLPMPGDRLPSQAHPGPLPDRIRLEWPLHGRINSDFGPRGKHSYHEGIDIGGRRGDPIRAAAAGVVAHAAHGGRYGRYVVIDHGGGVFTLYAHASRLLVGEGDQVERGDVIAEVGSTGNARGPHLHFEVRRSGHPVDPLPFLRSGSVEAAAR